MPQPPQGSPRVAGLTLERPLRSRWFLRSSWVRRSSPFKSSGSSPRQNSKSGSWSWTHAALDASLWGRVCGSRGLEHGRSAAGPQPPHLHPQLLTALVSCPAAGRLPGASLATHPEAENSDARTGLRAHVRQHMPDWKAGSGLSCSAQRLVSPGDKGCGVGRGRTRLVQAQSITRGVPEKGRTAGRAAGHQGTGRCLAGSRQG